MAVAYVKLLNNFANVQRAIREGKTAGLLKAGEYIVDLASQLAPKDTELLSESGDAHIENDELVVSFGNNIEDDRAVAQEFGTIYFPAQPYLIPAVREINIAAAMADAILDRLR